MVVGQSGRLANDSALHRSDNSSSTPPTQHFVLGSQHRLQQSAGARCPTLKGVGTGLHVRATAGARVGPTTCIMPARGPGNRVPLRVDSLLIVIGAFPLRNVAHRLRRNSNATTTVGVLLSQSCAKTPAPATPPVPTQRHGARASSRTPRQSYSIDMTRQSLADQQLDDQAPLEWWNSDGKAGERSGKCARDSAGCARSDRHGERRVP